MNILKKGDMEKAKHIRAWWAKVWFCPDCGCEFEVFETDKNRLSFWSDTPYSDRRFASTSCPDCARLISAADVKTGPSDKLFW